jgi:AraC family transcriptional regulator of adaptative response/methylated-DNA-[protein]-cysteine methyltransferase
MATSTLSRSAPAARTSLNDDACWQAVLERRATADGLFVVAVRTTRIYCRPTCRVKTPMRKNVRFYRSARQAEEAGFRACKRCHPADKLPPEATLVKAICRRLEAAETAPSLDELAAEFGFSKFHLQRLFRRAVGVSPRQYYDVKRLERAKSALRNGNGVAQAVYGAGYGSGSRLYERAGAMLGMTPGSYQRKGAGMTINYTIVTSPFGRMLVGATERGVSAVSFGDSDAPLERHLHDEYEGAAIMRDDAAMRPWVERVLRVCERGETRDDMLPLDIRATAFKLRVWQELRRIPRGEVRTYADIARAVGEPAAARAVGNACGSNPVAMVIPCHRVVRSDGQPGNYGWGPERKKKMLKAEGAL